MGQSERFSKRGSAPSGLKVMLPAGDAASGDCHTLDPVALGADLIGASEVDVLGSWQPNADALNADATQWAHQPGHP